MHYAVATPVMEFGALGKNGAVSRELITKWDQSTLTGKKHFSFSTLLGFLESY
jgi:hypothetical protein